jgi:hypothetical protein
METLLGIADLVVLLLLVILVPRVLWKEQSGGIGSVVLTICVFLVVLFMATVSHTVFIGLVEVSSPSMRGLLLVVLLGMAGLIALPWFSKLAV